MVLEAAMFPSKLKLSSSSSLTQQNHSFFQPTSTAKNKKNKTILPVARLLGPAVFEASKLKVVYVGGNNGEELQRPKLPRTYTLTHCDFTSKLTLAISQTINTSQLQGWYNRLQRDEVVGVWKKIKGKMSLHVHCHISGGHFLLDHFANLRYYIFCKELPLDMDEDFSPRSKGHGFESQTSSSAMLLDKMMKALFVDPAKRRWDEEDSDGLRILDPLRIIVCLFPGAVVRRYVGVSQFTSIVPLWLKIWA